MSTAQEGEKGKDFKFKLKHKNIFTGFVLSFFMGKRKNVKASAIAVFSCIFYLSLPAYELCTNKEMRDMQHNW